MQTKIYSFNDFHPRNESNYIFQYVQDRPLTSICHGHSFYEIVIVGRGHCNHTVNGNSLLMKTDDCSIICPNDTHYFVSQSPDLRLMSLSVAEEEFLKFCRVYSDAFSEKVKSHSLPTLVNLNGLFSGILTAFPYIKVNGKELDYKTMLAHIIHAFMSSLSKKKNIPEVLSSAVREMQNEENLKKGSAAFFDLTHYSEGHLERLMKYYYGMSIHSFLRNARLNNAYRRIILTSERTEDIAESVGYKSFSHFNKIFKETYGITPSALKKSRGIFTV